MAEAKLGGSTVKVEFDEGIAWVFLNRPEKRNAMSPTLNTEMTQTLEALEIDERCKVLVLTGAGDAFSAALAVSRARGLSLSEAVLYANAAGAAACLKFGAQPAMPTADEVRSLMMESGKEPKA